MRLLLLILAIWIAVFLVRQVLRQRKASARPGGESPVTHTVQCARCGVHLPVGTAIQHVDGRHYCSVEHARDDG